jgi:hypothetical protein
MGEKLYPSSSTELDPLQIHRYLYVRTHAGAALTTLGEELTKEVVSANDLVFSSFRKWYIRKTSSGYDVLKGCRQGDDLEKVEIEFFERYTLSSICDLLEKGLKSLPNLPVLRCFLRWYQRVPSDSRLRRVVLERPYGPPAVIPPSEAFEFKKVIRSMPIGWQDKGVLGLVRFEFDERIDPFVGVDLLSDRMAPGRGRFDDQGRSLSWFATECRSRALFSLDTLLLWLESQGYIPEYGVPESSFITTALDYFMGHLTLTFEKRMKFLTCLVQWKLLDGSAQKVPNVRVKPDPPPRPPCVRDGETGFLRGSPYKWFANRTLASRRADPDFFEIVNSVNAIKKRQPRLPEVFLAQSTEGWWDSLFNREPNTERHVVGHIRVETPQEAIGPLEVVRVREYARSEVDTLVRDVTRDVCSTLVSYYLRSRTPVQSFQLPSMRSREALKIKEGGHFAAVSAGIASGFRYNVDFKGLATYPDEVPVTDPFSFTRTSDYTMLSLGTFRGPSGPQEIKAPIMDDYLRYFKRIDSQVPLTVTPVALAEPFKVRMISKSLGDQYWLLQSIQKLSHQLINMRPEFRATHEDPQSGEDLKWVLDKTVPSGPLSSDEFYVSGDYKASTDNLDPALSELIVREICRAFRDSNQPVDPLVEDLWVRSLVGHVGPDGKLQTWGQLMGSPTSFPVLCLANYILYLTSLSLTRGKQQFMGRRVYPVAINGDDIGFRSNSRLYAVWRQITSEYGLSPSPGKNFVSRDFLQLNSQMFVPGTGDESGWQRITLVSLATLSPPRVVPFDEFFELAPALQRTYLDTTTGVVRDRLNSLFLDVWKEHLKTLSPIVNWFFPRSLGGLGLEYTSPEPFEDHCSPGHLRAASYIRGAGVGVTSSSWCTTGDSGPSMEKKVLEAPRFEKKTNIFELGESVMTCLAEKGLLQRVWSRETDRLNNDEPVDEVNLSLDTIAFLSGNVQVDPGVGPDHIPALRRRRLVFSRPSGRLEVVRDTAESFERTANRLREAKPYWFADLRRDLKRFARTVSDDRIITPEAVLAFGERKLIWTTTPGVTFEPSRPLGINPLAYHPVSIEKADRTEGIQFLKSRIPVALDKILFLTDVAEDGHHPSDNAGMSSVQVHV